MAHAQGVWVQRGQTWEIYPRAQRGCTWSRFWRIGSQCNVAAPSKTEATLLLAQQWRDVAAKFSSWGQKKFRVKEGCVKKLRLRRLCVRGGLPKTKDDVQARRLAQEGRAKRPHLEMMHPGPWEDTSLSSGGRAQGGRVWEGHSSTRKSTYT